MITKPQKVLEELMVTLHDGYCGIDSVTPEAFYKLQTMVRKAMVDWADAQLLVRMPWRFNPPQEVEGNPYGIPLHTLDFLSNELLGKDQELARKVRGTSYDELHKLLGTMGCSKESPYWVAHVMGVIETPKGALVLSPGDWLIEVTEGAYLVLDDPTYRKLYLDV